MDLIIKNGIVVSSEEVRKADILVKDGIIIEIGLGIEANDDIKEIDAAGMLVMPGGIDVHTHLDMPFMGTYSTDDFESGTIAAAFGGTTSIIDYIIPQKDQSLKDALNLWHKKADNKSIIDYGFHMAIIPPVENIISELSEIARLGVTSIKCFFAYKGSLMVDEASFIKLLEKSKKAGILVCVHAEDGEAIDEMTKKLLQEGKTDPIYHALSRPAEFEGKSVKNILNMAKLADIPVYFVHVSTKDALSQIIQARSNQRIYAETCPQYLLLTQDKYNEQNFEGAKYVMSPPLREREHMDYLANNIDFINTIATDHCPFNFNIEKQFGKNDFTRIPNGIPCIETRLPLMFNELVVKRGLPLTQFVELNCTNPAKIFGIPNKGDIKAGMDADLSIWNPDQKWALKAENLHQRADYTPFEGFEVIGMPITTILRGNIIIENRKLTAKSALGRFIKRA